MKDGTVRDYTKKPLGTVTRRYNGRNVAWIARCPKCGRRGSRYVFIPEETARRGGSKPNLSIEHKATFHNLYLAYWAVDDHCTVLLTEENMADLLNSEELAEFEAWRVRVA